MKRLWIGLMSFVAAAAAGKPAHAQVGKFCLLVDSTCYTAGECCSNRCNKPDTCLKVEDGCAVCVA